MTLFISHLIRPKLEEFINTKDAIKAETKTHSKSTEKSKLEYFEEIINMFVSLISPFLMEKVPCPFNYNHILKKWHISLQPTFVNVIFCARRIIGKVKITHNKLNRNFNFSTSPWSSKLPVSTNTRKTIR